MTDVTNRIILFSIMQEKNQLSTLSLAILGLIGQKPLSGYDVRKVFSTTPMGHFSSSPGAIYPALKRIEKNGWIKGEVKNRKTLRPKLVFKLTDTGRKVLAEHLTRPVTKDDVMWHMDDLMLRFAFLGHVVGRKQTVKFLKEFAAEVEAHLSSLRQYMDEVRETMSPYGRLAMDNGLDSYRVNARWARRAIKQLQQSGE
ncbi:MAG: PadR family transcriptional regulator [Phycisphaerales bacterium]|nr:MAG: PadR family transcriptional regulator [Phycisphaerales bacterium]